MKEADFHFFGGEYNLMFKVQLKFQFLTKDSGTEILNGMRSIKSNSIMMPQVDCKSKIIMNFCYILDPVFWVVKNKVKSTILSYGPPVGVPIGLNHQKRLVVKNTVICGNGIIIS